MTLSSNVEATYLSGLEGNDTLYAIRMLHPCMLGPYGLSFRVFRLTRYYDSIVTCGPGYAFNDDITSGRADPSSRIDPGLVALSDNKATYLKRRGHLCRLHHSPGLGRKGRLYSTKPSIQIRP
jgi:hypothetical protein